MIQMAIIPSSYQQYLVEKLLLAVPRWADACVQENDELENVISRLVLKSIFMIS